VKIGEKVVKRGGKSVDKIGEKVVKRGVKIGEK